MPEQETKPDEKPAKPHYQSVNNVVQVALSRLREERERPVENGPTASKA